MKRTFLKVALFSSLMLSMPLAFTSCKDYDEDIKNLENADVNLQSQIDALKQAAAAAQSSADAAMTAAQAAQTAANAANDAAVKAQKAAEAAAETAKAAAAQAKADAIKEALAQVNDLLKGYATTDQVKDVASQIAGIEANLNKLTTEVDGLKAAQSQMQTQLAALVKYEEYAKTVGLLQDQITDVKAEIAKINSALQNCVTEEKMNAAIDAVAKDLAKKNADLITLLTKQLRSLVFIPSLYINGIEATEYDYVAYKAMVKAANNGSGTTHAGAPFAILSNQDGNNVVWNAAGSTVATTYINKPRTVSYELNPTTAEVKGSDVKMIENYVEIQMTRATSPKITATGNVAVVNGNLKVEYTALGQYLNTDKEHGWIAATEVQNFNDASSSVGAVTSDYALFYGMPVTLKAIAYNSKPDGNEYKAEACAVVNNELWNTPVKAGSNVPSVTVQWDGNVDLSKIIEIHYGVESITTAAVAHGSMTLQQALDLYGLTATYTPVQYTVGTNVTSDTKFTTLNGSVVTPCGVTADGQPTGVANKNSVGRNPMYMVQIMDGNNVVLVGYIKLNIVEKKVEEPVVDVNTNVFPLGTVKFACNGGTATVTWAQINNYLLGIVGENGISRDEFVANYELVATNGIATQYGADHKALASAVGTITEVTNQTSATTDVLTWTLTMNDQQVIYEKANHTFVVYVAYQTKVDPAKNPKYFLPLQVSIQKPQDIDNSANVASKSQNYWMRNQTVAITNVKVPENGGVPTYFADIDDEWYHTSGGVQVPGPVVNVASAVTSAFGINSATFSVENGTDKGYKYYFTAANNRKVTGVPVNGSTATVEFSVNANTVQGILAGTSHAVSADKQGDHALLATNGEFMNTVLYAKIGSNPKEEVAVLDQNTGVVEYKDNATAKALLNAYASFDKAEANPLDRTPAKLFGTIGICAYYGCELVLPLTNASWDAYFLRPLNIEPVSAKDFQDAENNGSTLNVFDMLTFSDWRNVKLAGANTWLFAYYQVQGVTIDTTKILSNAANGSFAINQTINDCFTFNAGTPIANASAYNSAAANQTAVADAYKAAFGTLTYKNDGTNTQTFQVQIPMKISYYWGDIYVTVSANVKSTLLSKRAK